MRNLSLDLLKIFMAFFVFFIHLRVFSDTSHTIGYILNNGLFRVAVPVFIIINGFYLFDTISKKKTKLFLKKLSILYILWMAIYSKWWFDLERVDLTITNLIFGYYQLWYVPAVILSAALLIFLHKIRTKHLLTLSGLLLLAGMVLQAYVNNGNFDKIIPEKEMQYILYRNFLFDALPFLCIGYILRKKEDLIIGFLNNNAYVFYLIPLFIVLLCLESYTNLILFENSSSLDILFFSVPLSVLLFMACSYRCKIPGQTRILASLSSAVYFCHLFCIRISALIINKFLDGNFSYHIVISLIFTLCASLALVALKNRYPRFPLLP